MVYMIKENNVDWHQKEQKKNVIPEKLLPIMYTARVIDKAGYRQRPIHQLLVFGKCQNQKQTKKLVPVDCRV